MSVIVVVGATGNVGGALTRQLTAADAGVRAVTRDASRASVPAGVEVVEADLGWPQSLAAAFTGADGLFLVLPGPVDVPAVLRQARAAGLGRLAVVSSSLAGSDPDSVIGRWSLENESAVRASGLAWTILRPDELASNALRWASAIRHGEAVRLPRAGVAAPTIDPADVASVARVSLLEDGNAGQVYTLTGPKSVFPREQVRAIGDAIGRAVAVEEISTEQHADQLAEHMPRDIAESMAGLDRDGSQNGPQVAEVSPDVERVTGAAPRPFDAWAREHAGAFREAG